MGVFDANIKTKLKVADPLTDHTLPHPRSLTFKSITKTTALTGTKGAQCHLLHGDHWNEIKGNHIENIVQDQTIKVVGKHKETLVESCYQNMIGPQIVLNNNVRNETRLNKFTLVYGDNCMCQTSNGDQNVKPTDYSVITIADFEYDTLKQEIVVAHGEIVGIHGEAVACHAEAKLFHAETNAIHFAVDAFSNQDRDNEATIKLINAQIEMLMLDTSSMMMNTAGIEMHLGVETHAGLAMFADIMGTGVIVP